MMEIDGGEPRPPREGDLLAVHETDATRMGEVRAREAGDLVRVSVKDQARGRGRPGPASHQIPTSPAKKHLRPPAGQVIDLVVCASALRSQTRRAPHLGEEHSQGAATLVANQDDVSRW